MSTGVTEVRIPFSRRRADVTRMLQVLEVQREIYAGWLERGARLSLRRWVHRCQLLGVPWHRPR